MKSLIFFGILMAIFLTTISCTNGLRAEGNSLISSEEDSNEEWPTLYRFGQDGLWGFKDASGNIVIEPQYHVATSFSEGLAFVRLPDGEDKTGFIDVEGNLVIPLPGVILFGSGFSEGLATIVVREWDWATEDPLATETLGPFIYIDRTGKDIFYQEFETAFPFRNGLAIVSLYRDYMMFIDKTGQNAFGRKFRFISHFDGDYARVVLLDGTSAYINRSGEIVNR